MSPQTYEFEIDDIYKKKPCIYNKHKALEYFTKEFISFLLI